MIHGFRHTLPLLGLFVIFFGCSEKVERVAIKAPNLGQDLCIIVQEDIGVAEGEHLSLKEILDPAFQGAGISNTCKDGAPELSVKVVFKPLSQIYTINSGRGPVDTAKLHLGASFLGEFSYAVGQQVKYQERLAGEVKCPERYSLGYDSGGHRHYMRPNSAPFSLAMSRSGLYDRLSEVVGELHGSIAEAGFLLGLKRTMVMRKSKPNTYYVGSSEARFKSIGKSGIDLLLTALNRDVDPIMRSWVVMLLYNNLDALDDTVMEPLISALKDEDDGVADSALKTLRLLTGRNWGSSWTCWWTWWKWRQLLSLPVINSSRNEK